MPTVTFCNELNDNKIGYPSYVPRATHRFTFDSLKNKVFLTDMLCWKHFVEMFRISSVHYTGSPHKDFWKQEHKR